MQNDLKYEVLFFNILYTYIYILFIYLFFCLKHKQISANEVRKINLIQRENKIIFSDPTVF